MKINSSGGSSLGRLPKRTGAGPRLEPIKSKPLFNPALTPAGSARVRAHFARFKPITPKEAIQATKKRLAEAVETINIHIKESRVFRGLRFEVDEASNRTVATITDTRTGQVVKKIPGEAAMHIYARLSDIS